jgi:hypothetical protein
VAVINIKESLKFFGRDTEASKCLGGISIQILAYDAFALVGGMLEEYAGQFCALQAFVSSRI